MLLKIAKLLTEQNHTLESRMLACEESRHVGCTHNAM